MNRTQYIRNSRLSKNTFQDHVVYENFQRWNKSVWYRVHKVVRMKVGKVLSDNRVIVDANLVKGEDGKADPLTGQEKTKLTTSPNYSPPIPLTKAPFLTKTLRLQQDKKEEKLTEEPAPARSECVHHFEEKQASAPSPEHSTADVDDKPCVSLSTGRCTDLRKNGDLDDECHREERLAEPPERQKIPADARATVPPVGKDPAVDKDSVVDRALVVLPDPPDLQRRSSSDGEGPAKSPDEKGSPENSLHADPAVSKDLAVGVVLHVNDH
ncbi:hypothetical protein E4U60_003131 [Claviceps pazoutovae]|uniref:Uncharacterized protein n=1 Tax=Claviceps pazoutovae TaxID=1649127 RepID=A0A9P7SGC0_9HYPO|nr:hypothetical protein E4U60_003131 [Claviceps pazoutovae]